MNCLSFSCIENFNLASFRYVPSFGRAEELKCDLCGESYGGFVYEEKVNSLFQVAVISLVNLFAMIAFRSRKWVLVPAEQPNRWVYVNTWSFKKKLSDRLQELRYVDMAWQKARLKGRSAYVSRKINLTKYSYWLTPRHIFMKLKTRDADSPEDGFSKRCKMAIDLLTGKTVARLVPLSRMYEKDKTCSFLLKEMNVLERLKGCPSIVQMLDVEERDVAPDLKKRAIYLEFYNRGDLFACYMEKGRSLRGREKIKIIGDLIQAVAFMHKAGIVHNDIKMENVLVKEEGHGVAGALCDFDHASDDKNFPQNFGGSVLWSSPEKIWVGVEGMKFGHEDRKKADVWALGLVLFVVLLGKIPSFLNRRDKESTQRGIKELFLLHKRSGSFFPKPKDGNSIDHLVWQMLQCSASKRLDIDQVVERWEALANRQHLIF